MRWLLGIILTIGLLVFGGYILLKGYPYRLYSNWMAGKEWNRYYSLSNYTSSYLRPVSIEEIPPYKEDYAQLWREFPLRNANIPLPVRHPMFQTIPVLDGKNTKLPPQLGIVILAPNGRELSRVYTMPMNLYEDHSQGQDLFKLPFVRNRILKLDLVKLWKDIFSYQIDVKSKSLDEMIYDLYILHLRSKYLPKGTIKYGLIKQGEQALIELVSKDKDYIIEMILTNNSGNIYSYILKTEKNNDESRKLRSKFLENISFQSADPAMGKFLYTEFKQLNFARQVDQEGMLYLFSAWSQDIESEDLLKEMIFYLERGRNNELQLKPLYRYALKKYGKTFTTRKNVNESDDAELALQRKIEVEDMDRKLDLELEKNRPTVAPDLTPDEKMNLYLKKAKEEGPVDNKDMTIH